VLSAFPISAFREVISACQLFSFCPSRFQHVSFSAFQLLPEQVSAFDGPLSAFQCFSFSAFALVSMSAFQLFSICLDSFSFCSSVLQ
jgi:hypothetical protein